MSNSASPKGSLHAKASDFPQVHQIIYELAPINTSTGKSHVLGDLFRPSGVHLKQGSVRPWMLSKKDGWMGMYTHTHGDTYCI